VLTADAGASYLNHSRPDLILFDFALPWTSGAAFLRTCKDDASLAQIPVVVMSGPMRSMHPGEASPDAVVQKPFDIDELSRTVRRWIGDEAALATEAIA
jgi:CheY-like chemotaxis protein